MTATGPSPPDIVAPSNLPRSPPPLVRRKRSVGPIVAVVVVLVLIVAALAVSYEEGWLGNKSSGTTSGCPQGVTLQGNGAQFVAPLLAQWAPAFNSVTQNLVNYPASGSGTGITDFNGTTVDFAITDEPLDAAQTKYLPSPALTIPIVGGALAIIYNLPGVTPQLHLNGTLLADIYLGTITNWNDTAIRAANPGVSLPNQTIYTVHRADPAGTTYVLTDLLSDDSIAWNHTVGQGISVQFPTAGVKEIAEKGNTAVLTEVETTDYTIGYSDLTDVLDAKTPPAYAAIENPQDTWVSPTIATTASAIQDQLASITLPTSSGNWFNVSLVNAKGTNDYPLATFVYLFVYKALDQGFAPSSAKAQVIIQWLTWVVSSTAQAYANDTSGASPLYYVPLPSSVVQVDQSGIQSLTFNGATVPTCS